MGLYPCRKRTASDLKPAPFKFSIGHMFHRLFAFHSDQKNNQQLYLSISIS